MDHLNEKSDCNFDTKILKMPRQFGAKLDILFVVIVFALNVIIAYCPEREWKGWSRDNTSDHYKKPPAINCTKF